MRIEWNEAGFDQLLTSPAAQALVDQHAEALADRANSVPSTTSPPATEPYYEVEDTSDEHRARRRVQTTGARAAAHEAKTHALQQGMSNG